MLTTRAGSAVWFRALRVALVLGFAAIVASQLNLAELRTQLNWRYGLALLFVQPLIVGGLFIHAIRLSWLLNVSASRAMVPFKASLLGIGLNLALPGRISELIKISYLSMHGKIPYDRCLAGVFLERTVDILIVATAGIAVTLSLATGAKVLPFLLTFIGFAVTLFFFPRLSPWAVRLGARLFGSKVAAFLARFSEHVTGVLQSGVFLKALLAGLFTWVLSALNVWLFVRTAGAIPVSVEIAVLLFVATTIGSAIPGLPGGFGAYEAAAIFVLMPAGYSFEQALALGLSMHVSQYLIATLGTIFLLTRDRLGISDLIKRVRN